MRSHLTRGVFRRLLANQPVILHRHFHRPPRTRSSHRHGRFVVTQQSARTLFGVFGAQSERRDVNVPSLDDGMEKMLELDKRIHLVARLPPPVELATAFRAFIERKRNSTLPLEDFHAAMVLQTLQTLEDQNEEEKEQYLTLKDLSLALETVAATRGSPTEIHQRLGKRLWRALQERFVQGAGEHFPDEGAKCLRHYIRILCATGNSTDARTVLESRGQVVPNGEQDSDVWLRLLQGFAKEDQEQQMVETTELMRSRGIPFTPAVHAAMVSYYAMKNNVAKTKEWFITPVLEYSQDDTWSTNSIYRILLEFSLRNSEMQWAHGVLGMTEGVDNRQSRDAMLLAAAATGENVDDINDMIWAMKRRATAAGQEFKGPEVHTFNGLVKFAISKSDAYQAERFFAFMKKWNVKPDAESFMLQVEYRLLANDLSGAITAYRRLREFEIEENEDFAITNKLARRLASSTSKTNHETIMAVVGDLIDTRKLIYPDTILALCTYHLHRDEYFEVVDLLQTYSPQFSISIRCQIRDVLAEYALNPSTDVGRAWDTYMIFHQVFDLETRRDLRTRAMSVFFARGRADLALHVFTRMTRHPRADTRPAEPTYVAALEGAATTREAEALEIVHNLLKLDTDTEPSTRLANALMLAYDACGQPARSLEFWHEIASSDEGPSYESLQIALRACQHAPFGFRTAQRMWARLKAGDVEIGRDLFASYVAALTGNGLFDEAIEELNSMAKVVSGGARPDQSTIGAFYNAAAGKTIQRNVEEWAQAQHPEIWAELKARGFARDEEGYVRVQGIDRVLKP